LANASRWCSRSKEEGSLGCDSSTDNFCDEGEVNFIHEGDDDNDGDFISSHFLHPEQDSDSDNNCDDDFAKSICKIQRNFDDDDVSFVVTSPLSMRAETGQETQQKKSPESCCTRSYDIKLNRSDRKVFFLIISIIFVSWLALMMLIGAIEMANKTSISPGVPAPSTDSKQEAAFNNNAYTVSKEIFLPAASADLTKTCALKNIFNEDGFEDCEEECSSASCCVVNKSFTESHCFVGKWKEVCMSYKPCKSINSLFLGLTLDPVEQNGFEVEKTLDKSKVSGEGIISAAVSSNLGRSRDTSSDKSTSIDKISTKGDLEVEKLVAEACSEPKMKTGEGIDFCRETCELAACCFDLDSSQENCSQTKSILCEAFSPCVALIHK